MSSRTGRSHAGVRDGGPSREFGVGGDAGPSALGLSAGGQLEDVTGVVGRSMKRCMKSMAPSRSPSRPRISGKKEIKHV